MFSSGHNRDSSKCFCVLGINIMWRMVPCPQLLTVTQSESLFTHCESVILCDSVLLYDTVTPSPLLQRWIGKQLTCSVSWFTVSCLFQMLPLPHRLTSARVVQTPGREAVCVWGVWSQGFHPPWPADAHKVQAQVQFVCTGFPLLNQQGVHVGEFSTAPHLANILKCWELGRSNGPNE